MGLRFELMALSMELTFTSSVMQSGSSWGRGWVLERGLQRRPETEVTSSEASSLEKPENWEETN